MLTFLNINYSQTLYVSDLKVKDFNGSLVTLNDILTSETGTILVFWETNNPKCNSNLENLQESWTDELKDSGVKLIAICENVQGDWLKIKPYVYGKDWDFEVYIDENRTLERSLEINSRPYTVLLDENNNIKCRYPGYCSGDETIICDKIAHCLAKNGSLSALK